MSNYSRYRAAQRQYDDEITDESDPYAIGYDCGVSGLDRDRNPHRALSSNWYEWRDGWEDGWKERYHI